MNKDKQQTENEKYKEQAEEYSKDLDISLANLEKLGVSFLLIGYVIYMYSANLDIKDTLGINNTGIKPSESTYEGAKLVFYGYIILYIVSYERTQQKIWENEVFEESTSIYPFELMQTSYFISIIANILRVEALAQMVAQDTNEDTFV